MREFLSNEIDLVINDNLEWYNDTLNNDTLLRHLDKSGLEKDIKILETLTEEDKENIINKLIDDEHLTEVLHETINYYIFHK